MKFKSTKRKLEKLRNRANKNEQDRKRKENNIVIPKINNTILKPPRVVYESDWLTVPSRTGNVSSTLVNTDDALVDVFSGIAFGALRTALRGQPGTMQIDVNYNQIVNLPERLLPFVKMAVMFKDQPNLTPVALIDDYSPYLWEEEPYVIVKGDGQKIYEALGAPSSSSIYLRTDISAMSVSASLTSTIYQADINWEGGGSASNRRIEKVETVYNFNTITASDSSTREDSDRFYCEATDFVSSASVSGTGRLIQRRWTWDDSGGPVVWTETVTLTKNTTVTAPLFVQTSSTGINDTLASSMSDVRKSQSNGIDWVYLWYSNKRARRFKLNGSYDLLNVPLKTDYQGDILPYTSINVKVNPDPHPVKNPPEPADRTFRSTLNNPIWVNVEPQVKYMMKMYGTYQFSAPSNEESLINFDFNDETWTQDANTYELLTENRDPKELPVYSPIIEDVQMKIVLTLNTPNAYYEVNKNDTTERK